MAYRCRCGEHPNPTRERYGQLERIVKGVYRQYVRHSPILCDNVLDFWVIWQFMVQERIVRAPAAL
jgi:hypothetical protein